MTTADADGNWNFDISRNLSDNVYKITVESIDPLGRTSSVDYQLTIDSFTPILLLCCMIALTLALKAI